MYQIKVNDKVDFTTEVKDGKIVLNGAVHELDLVKLNQSKYSLIIENKSYNLEVVEISPDRKQFKVKVNNTELNLNVKDQYDQLLKNLGFENLNSSKLKEIKAPMPGLVLKILVNEGDEIKKGENLLVLEAMKMENMIKAPADINIKNISVNSGDKVEKNQILLVLD